MKDNDTTATVINTIAIIGAGPSGLFMLKRLLENGGLGCSISLFEKTALLGSGMPYSEKGACREHITNVSANEIPPLVTSVKEWLENVPENILESYGISRSGFNEYKVLPRLLFGKYLEAQFDLLLVAAARSGIEVKTYLSNPILDVKDGVAEGKVRVFLSSSEIYAFDRVVICTGHTWPKTHEGKIGGYFDSPYPPAKLQIVANHSVAIRGSSLTAIDAIRTLARYNGKFKQDGNGGLVFEKNKDAPNFQMVMHSKKGLLPAVRFHLEDPHLGNKFGLTEDEIQRHIKENNGFLSLDYIFEHDFKKILLERDPEVYEKMAHAKLEEFTDFAMQLREDANSFEFFEEEFKTAEKSIARRESIYWKELLAILSFELNYPAKYLSAEDSVRLHSLLKPLIAIVIAFVPQASALEMLALHRAGALSSVSVGENSEVVPGNPHGAVYKHSGKEHYFQTFVDCIGQPSLSLASFPFEGVKEETITPASLKFKENDAGRQERAAGNEKVFLKGDDFYLSVSGIAITDDFQVVGADGNPNERIFIMAVPFIGGYNPDYSGLDFCEEASLRIVRHMDTSLKNNL